MSYDVFFRDPVSGETLRTDEPHFMRGGTFKVGGECELYLNITYNYEKNYSPHKFSIQDLNEKHALTVIPELERVIALLGDDCSENYWTPVDGNAKRALIILLTMAKMRPDAVIEVM